MVNESRRVGNRRRSRLLTIQVEHHRIRSRDLGGERTLSDLAGTLDDQPGKVLKQLSRDRLCMPGQPFFGHEFADSLG
ncbi:hypothetical protein GCM10023152_29760 [Agromyces bauzanensis]|uniref:Uncharacterized protein n=1 Tax=Agromyces bauzanensis TaxID=1308924 RepID=A0A917PWF4_9MICO|nr:hypothetical protein GCM10011372_35890 [Agromyces bauzanensis]